MARGNPPLAAFFQIFEYIVLRSPYKEQQHGTTLNLFIFPYLSVLSQVAVVLVVLYVRRNLVSEMKILAMYFVLSSLLAIVQLYLAEHSINNLWTVEFFCPIQFAFLILVFRAWNKQPFAVKLFSYSIPAFVIGWGLSSLWFGGLIATLAYADPISAVILVLVSSYTMLRIDRLEGSSVLDVPAFWVSSATLVYFGGTVVLSTLHTALLKASIETMRLAWSSQAILNVLANVLYAGGFLCLRRKT